MNAADTQDRYYAGIRMVRYDLVKELVLALLAVSLVVIGLAGVLSSPDDPAVTIQAWATKDPVAFVTTAASELSGESGTATLQVLTWGTCDLAMTHVRPVTCRGTALSTIDRCTR